MREETRGKIACAIAGAMWGLFWIPLRALEGQGIAGPWALFLFFLVPLILGLPLLRRERLEAFGPAAQLPAILVGLSTVLYSYAAIETTIYRALIFFYLTPLWSTLLGLAFLGERLTRERASALVLGGFGIIAMTSGGIAGGLDLNAGDWAALAGGILWSASGVLLRRKPDTRPGPQTVGAFFWATLATLLVALIADPARPSAELVAAQAPWLVPTLAIMVLPVVYLAIWGTRFVSPGTAGLLFMTEIGISALSAALLSGDPLGWREIAGIALITAAGLTEGVAEWRQRRLASEI